ncbi:MAG TPA: TetR/AcrR family transcriptional regulator [Myxococcota bacterium]|jgi:TetR/AcrR family transcriptional regulator|nr:TetR/AcrR family transcriptional regulator [Myxococcota bacterium]
MSADTRSPGEPRSVDTRNKILEVSEREFAQEGYAGAHLQSIAEQVGVQKTALYYYYPSKAALYTAVLARMLEAFDRRVTEVLLRSGTPEQRLESLVDALNALLAENPTYSKILIRVFVDRAQVVDTAAILPPIQSVIGKILRFHQEGVEAGAFRRTSSRHFFQSLLGMTVFHYAASFFSANVLGVEDIFTGSVVHWRRDEMRKLLSHGVLAREEPKA